MRTANSKSKAGKKTPAKKRQPRATSGSGVAFNPDSQLRTIIMLYKALGLTNEQVATQLTMLGHPVSARTLERKCKDELENATHRLNVQVIGKLYQNAMQTGDLKASNTAAIFWAKAFIGLSDGGHVKASVKTTDTDANGEQIEREIEFTLKVDD